MPSNVNHVNCDVEIISSEVGRATWRCRRCNFSDSIPEHNAALVSRPCPVASVPACHAGCRLTQLLAYIGNEYEPDCGCKSEAANMDAGATTIEATIEVMRVEAERRKLFEPRETDSIVIAKARKKAADDFEHNARWLILLAYKLDEENREPDTYEQFKLRLMRYGNRLIMASQ